VALAKSLKAARWVLWRNPENLTERQTARLEEIAQTNQPLYLAYLLKEQLRLVFQLPVDEAIALLGDWVTWAHEMGDLTFHLGSRRPVALRPPRVPLTPALGCQVRLIAVRR
jgi:transposase